MPRYDVSCLCQPEPQEIYASMAEMRAGLTCAVCGTEREQRFSPATLPGVRIECSGEPSTDPNRIADGTANLNLGLRGVDTVVGTRKDGKPKLDYRPLTVGEASSRRKVSEIAKQQGLVPHADTGRYRTVVK